MFTLLIIISVSFVDNIDDDTIVDFFKGCGELTGLRWMTRQETSEFRVSSR